MKREPDEGMLRDSILVVAHPDDEALWFSSILGKVGEIVVCFLDSPGHPEWGRGRARSLGEYPVANISSLELEESGAFNCADWENPTITFSGIDIVCGRAARRRYRDNFRELRALLKGRLKGRRNVFTHNPWGEYGHEEHVQLYRVVESLQRELGFDLWFSNYCSNRSYPLMLEYIHSFDSDYVTLPTDSALGEAAREIYRNNGCWTWMDDYLWFNEESFMVNFGQRPKHDAGENGHIFPLNFMKIRFPPPGQERHHPATLPVRLARKAGRIGRRLLSSWQGRQR